MFSPNILEPTCFRVTLSLIRFNPLHSDTVTAVANRVKGFTSVTIVTSRNGHVVIAVRARSLHSWATLTTDVRPISTPYQP